MKREEVRGTALDLLDDAGLTTMPVDVEAFATYLDIRVQRDHQLDNGIAGLLYRGSEWDTIVVNGQHHLARQRFTIAHEIGHWWLDPPGTLWHVAEESESEALWEQELAANTFAAELLMPESLLCAEWGRTPDRVVLSWLFRVSRRAMARRLHELGLNGSESYEPWDMSYEQ